MVLNKVLTKSTSYELLL